MKPLVTMVAFSAAVGATALIVAIQRDPFTFTSYESMTASPLETSVQVVPVALPLAVTEPEPQAPAVVTLEEVRVEATPTRRWRAAPPPEPDLLLPTQVPAPCVDGEYRKLDEHRGVYLSCP